MRSRSKWNLEVFFFLGEGKKKYRAKNLSEQGREPTTNSTHIHVWRHARIRTQTTLVGREASALTTAPLRIFVSSGAVHCFVAAAKLKFQTGH